jgi:hypothetical protein
MCRDTACGPPYPYEASATIVWGVTNLDAPSSPSAALELRYGTSSDAGCSSFDTSAAASLTATAASPSFTVPRGESTCNPWGAVTSWGVYQPYTGCDDMCGAASDGDCDDGGPGAEYSSCQIGTDCTDCGPRTGDDQFFGTITINQDEHRRVPHPRAEQRRPSEHHRAPLRGPLLLC